MNFWNRPDRPLILASNSPRRADILTGMGLSFSQVSPNIENEDDFIDSSDLQTSLRNLAFTKALSIAKDSPEVLVLGGDTIVVLDNYIMGKPSGRSEAAEMLQNLSGKTHQVLSGIALVCTRARFSSSSVAVTNVTFRNLDQIEIDHYLDQDEYADKAGAYGIQGRAMTLIESLEGCYYNVVGLPVSKAVDLFKEYALLSQI